MLLKLGTTRERPMIILLPMNIITLLKLFGKGLRKSVVRIKIVGVPDGACTLFVSMILLVILSVGRKQMYCHSEKGILLTLTHTISILYRFLSLI